MQLRETGVQISVDDFGTSYSSFSVLHDLPIGEIKVDRSFVSRIGESGEGEEVVRAIVAMGRALGKRVVAEGIETDVQRAVLIELGCTRGQGFLLSSPMEPGELAQRAKHAPERLAQAA
jgi:EAL domain-containing protein (putative c-di-GMP-specific phosphodiesterase class I)